jgi:hypothetical protein
MTTKQIINENAQKHIQKNKDTAQKMGVWKGLNYSKAIKRILCRKCLSMIMREFGNNTPEPDNPELYCKYCRARIERLTKDTYEVK